MRKIKAIGSFLVLSAALIALSSCGSMADAIVGGITGGGGVAGGGTAVAEKEMADLKSDEILAGGEGGQNMMDVRYYVGKVMTAASAQTKNQAEVLFVNDGSKNWVEYTIPSHKASKDELQVGMIVLFPTGWSGYKEMDADNYRKNGWDLGRITSTDEMFKDLVEVAGDKYGWKIVRVPDIPIKE